MTEYLCKDDYKCPACNGSGQQRCDKCDGSGKYFDYEKQKIKDCERCQGEGVIGECPICGGDGIDHDAIYAEEARHNNPRFIILPKDENDPQDLKERLEEKFGEIEEDDDEFIIPTDPNNDLYPNISEEDIQNVKKNLTEERYSEEEIERFMHGFQNYWNIYKGGSLEEKGADLAKDILRDRYEEYLYIEKEKMKKEVEKIRGTEAIMKLKRLPTNEELEETSLEAESFLEAFNNQSTGDNCAYIRDCGDHVILDGWYIKKADWFKVIK